MPLQLVLPNFIKHRTNIAVVIDEFGGTAGVIRSKTCWNRFSARSRTSTTCPT